MGLAKECGVIKVEFFHMKDSNTRPRGPNDCDLAQDGRDKAIVSIAEKTLKGQAVDCATS